ncbi:hypothetical protein Y1Q_0005440 [Alligator mississippiensis]|uniref:SCAN box domain-containing protein n=1 Tax=Alligator mississippiensis TaxID=8496 RepID=A0A151MEJ3_ALLMI|nr:hypothetical protein Y1Q_0005440 [Alligator mississippiensis]
MPKMTKDDDLEAYIKAFERHALMTGLDQGYWASQLGALVVGKAQAAYRALSREDARDYALVKQAILYRLEIIPGHYRRLFRAKKGPDERRPRVLLQLSRDLLDKWVNPAGHDREALADQIVREQFQNDLEERTQRWVWQHTPLTCEEALKLAEAFTALEASYPRERKSPGYSPVNPKEPERRRPPGRGATRETRVRDTEVARRRIQDCKGWLGETQENEESGDEANELDLNNFTSCLQFQEAQAEDQEI